MRHCETCPKRVIGPSRVTLRKRHQNLWWTAGYNVDAFAFAAGVFYPMTINPEVAAIAMSGSSLLVGGNAGSSTA
jgi:Cu2+-exporting ATPase